MKLLLALALISISLTALSMDQPSLSSSSISAKVPAVEFSPEISYIVLDDPYDPDKISFCKIENGRITEKAVYSLANGNLIANEKN